eukprot:jgi/Chrzof1/9994/Cz04g23100.t1
MAVPSVHMVPQQLAAVYLAQNGYSGHVGANQTTGALQHNNALADDDTSGTVSSANTDNANVGDSTYGEGLRDLYLSDAPDRTTGRGSRASRTHAQGPKRGQGYRKLWAAVSQLEKGQRLSDRQIVSLQELTVEDLLKVLRNLPKGASAVSAVSQGLQYIDSRYVLLHGSAVTVCGVF